MPRCNSEIWSENLTPSLRTSDINLQRVLNTLLKATFSIVELSDELVQLKASVNANIPVNSLIEKSEDAIALLSHASQELNQRTVLNLFVPLSYRNWLIMCRCVQLSFWGMTSENEFKILLILAKHSVKVQSTNTQIVKDIRKNFRPLTSTILVEKGDQSGEDNTRGKWITISMWQWKESNWCK